MIWRFLVLVIAISACLDSDKRASHDSSAKQLPAEPAPVITDPDPSPPVAVDPAPQPPVNSDPVEGSQPAETKLYSELMSACNSEYNRAWIPPGEGTAQPACGAPLVEWSCCLDQAIALYSQLTGDIEKHQSQYRDQKLYNCAQTSDDVVTLYFFAIDGYSYQYSSLQLKGKPSENSDASSGPVLCPTDAVQGAGEALSYDGKYDGIQPHGDGAEPLGGAIKPEPKPDEVAEASGDEASEDTNPEDIVATENEVL